MKKNIYASLLISIFLISGCSSFIDKIHKQIDDEERGQNPIPEDKFGQFRNMERNTRPDLPKASQYSSYIESRSNNVLPKVKRNYRPKGRVNADDLLDNGTEGSLWSGRGQENFLFAKNNIKKINDIVVIRVLNKLKDEIAMELSRSFPKPKPRPDEKKENTAAATTGAQENAQEDQETEKFKDDKEFDRISTMVVEEISKSHILVRGRKDVLFRGLKRFIEVQALVPRRYVADDDTVASNNVLETNIEVLR